MCGVMLAMCWIIFVLDLFKFPVTSNSFTRFPFYTILKFATVSYCSLSSCCCSLAVSSCCCSLASSSSASFLTMSFNLYRPYSIFSIILLYNEQAVSCMLSSLFASASRVAVTGADTGWHNFEIVFLKSVPILYYTFLEKFFSNFMDRKNN